MPWSFWAAYLVKLAILGVALAALYALARAFRRRGVWGCRARRYVEVIESTMLSPQTAVHLLRVGTRYLLVGGGNGGLFKLAQFEEEELGMREGVM